MPIFETLKRIFGGGFEESFRNFVDEVSRSKGRNLTKERISKFVREANALIKLAEDKERNEVVRLLKSFITSISEKKKIIDSDEKKIKEAFAKLTE